MERRPPWLLLGMSGWLFLYWITSWYVHILLVVELVVELSMKIQLGN